MTSLLTFLVLGSPQAPEAPRSPEALVSRVTRRYSEASRAAGTIRMRQSVGNVAVTFDTAVQFERPDKLYIFTRNSRGQTWRTVSDGHWCTYEVPNHLDRGSVGRLYDRLEQRSGRWTLREVYRAAAESQGDRSDVLDLVISHPQHVQGVVARWLNLRLTAGEGGLWTLSGSFREFNTAPVSGTFELVADAEGDIRSYRLRELVQIPNEGAPREIRTEWTVDVAIGAAGDPNLYRVNVPRRNR